MKHKDLGIWMDRGSGAQQWQRAAFGISVFAGIVTAIALFAVVWNTKTISLEKEASITWHNHDLRSPLGKELAGYIQNRDGLHTNEKIQHVQQETGTQTTEKSPSARITSLFPQSYLAYSGAIFPFQTEQGAIKLQIKTPTQPTDINGRKTAITVDIGEESEIYELIEQNEGEFIIKGRGSESRALEIARNMNKSISTAERYLENGERVQVITEGSEMGSVEQSGEITTIRQNNPFSLITYNTQTRVWTAQNTQLTSETDAEQETGATTGGGDEEKCKGTPIGMYTLTQDNLLDGIFNFVTINTDNYKIGNGWIRMCITVDNL